MVAWPSRTPFAVVVSVPALDNIADRAEALTWPRLTVAIGLVRVVLMAYKGGVLSDHR